jgi:hypothetical protein
VPVLLELGAHAVGERESVVYFGQLFLVELLGLLHAGAGLDLGGVAALVQRQLLLRLLLRDQRVLQLLALAVVARAQLGDRRVEVAAALAQLAELLLGGGERDAHLGQLLRLEPAALVEPLPRAQLRLEPSARREQLRVGVGQMRLARGARKRTTRRARERRHRARTERQAR